MLQVQLGKASGLFAGWGVRRKDLSRFLETGVVKASLSGGGKGSLRFLDERSVYDVYLAHTFKDHRGGHRRGRIRRPIKAQFTRRKGRDGRCHHHGGGSAAATSWARG